MGPLRAGAFGLFLDGDQPALLVGLADAVALWVPHRVAEEYAAVVAAVDAGDAAVQEPGEAGAMKYVVAQHQCCGVVADVVCADEECLG
jgi:hypothetical protein